MLASDCELPAPTAAVRHNAGELVAAPSDHSLSIRGGEDAARVSSMRTAVCEFCRRRTNAGSAPIRVQNHSMSCGHVTNPPCREKAAAAQEKELAKRAKAGTFAESAAVAREARLGEREAVLVAREAAAQHAEVILQNRAS